MTFTGPSPELMERYSRATQAPSIMALGLDGVTAFNERVIAARTFEGLSAADQQLIVAAEAEINAGASPTLVDPEEWGPWDDVPAAPAVAEAKSAPGDDGGWVGL